MMESNNKLVLVRQMPAVGRGFIEKLEPPDIKNFNWTNPAPQNNRKVAIISTAAVSKRGDRPFSWLARDYRVIGKNDRDLVMTHVAVEYDRTAWQQDLNTIIPLDRLIEMAKDNEIGSVAENHYTFMGAADPRDMEKSALEVSQKMKKEAVDTVFLVPV
ncbi:MAG: glycine/sarcosine/betaine reductase selenoprotein B family protein [Paracoccaceae bacterium]